VKVAGKIGGSGVETTIEFNYSWTQTDSKAITDTETKTITETANITIPAKSTMTATVQIKRASGLSVPMECKRWLVKENGTRVSRGSVKGTFTFDIVGSSVVEWSKPTPAPTTSGQSGVVTKVTDATST
jgi:hypothetical protein